ncbi:Wzz/FepE/Etk N-terminal domain-containing protein [Alkalilimnicola ehrlichii]|nr:Wzz/FepE/Etk N-terminal domain-containing protein [Alkalilimnicola ehrlichii]
MRQPQTERDAELYYRDDEISLYDLFNVLVDRWWVIAAVFLATVLLGGAVAFSSTPSYEFRSGVDIGYIYRGEVATGDRYRLIESPDASRARLAEVVVPEVRRMLAATNEAIPRVNVEVRESDAGLVLISSAPASQVGLVEELHTQVVDALAERHQPLFERELALVVRQLEVRAAALDEELTSLREQAELLSERDHAAGAERGIVALIDAQRTSDLRRDIATVRSQLAPVKASIQGAETVSQSTQLSFLVSQSEQPVSGGKALVLALSIVLGLMGGVFAALFWEFVANARRARKESL